MAGHEEHERSEQHEQVGALTRHADVDMGPEELWSLVADGEGWSRWLADDTDVPVEPGGRGRLVDDEGVRREVRVDDVVPGRSVRFTWWPEADHERRSTVELVVVPRPTGSRLVVTEVLSPRARGLVVRAAARSWGRALSGLAGHAGACSSAA